MGEVETADAGRRVHGQRLGEHNPGVGRRVEQLEQERLLGGGRMGQVAGRGMPALFFENENIALDIDEPKDLERFLAYGYQGGESTRVARELLAADVTPTRQGSGGI